MKNANTILPFVLTLPLALSCAATPDDSSTPTLGVDQGLELDLANFNTNVDPVFERRCGSLDCHGSTARGLRIYSQDGLRLPNDQGITPGNAPTTATENNDNFASILGLQPERMNDFLSKNPRTADDAYQLIILTKPLALERHKGGTALVKGEPAEQCIVLWLIGQTGVTDQQKGDYQNLCAKGSALP
jgi:hypothetical protein